MDELTVDVMSTAALEAAGADAAAKEAELRRRVAQTGGDCLNCGADLTGRFCSTCGQSAVDLHRPFWALAMDALEGLFSFDGRFWRTAPLMLWRPAYVTRLYLNGARARFVQPFRLFLFSVLGFFLVFSVVSGDATGWLESDGVSVKVNGVEVQDRQAAVDDAIDDLDAAAKATAGTPAEAGLKAARRAIEEAEAEDQANPKATTDPIEREKRDRLSRLELKCGFHRALVWEDRDPTSCAEAEILAAELGETVDASVELNVGERYLPLDLRKRLAANADIAIDQPGILIASILRQAPKAVFALAPAYALMLALMHFWRRKIFLYDHLIVAIQFHTFLLMLIGVLMIFGQFVPSGAITLVFALWSNLGLYRMHRHVYGHGRISSFIRTLILDILYLFVLAFAFTALFAAGVIFI